MSVILTIARREVASFFRLPVGWVCVALFMFLAGLLMVTTSLTPDQPASMRAFFAFAGWLLMPVVPAVSMRLISEELRSGTIEPLMTSPASDLGIVVGKYLGGLIFLAVLILPTATHAAVLVWVSDPAPDPGPIVSGYLALMLVGGFYLSVGLLISTLTGNQTLAYVLAFFSILGLLAGPGLLGALIPPGEGWSWAREVLAGVAVNPRAADFSRGVVDTSHVVYFVSGSALFVVLSALALASRRWR
ncbi:MAG: ABC transporter permease subunit [Phycisphaeraceae bacterium]|nr:MAG: ABC transporter permease subunit [Phycisphaeraceae bacterium]